MAYGAVARAQGEVFRHVGDRQNAESPDDLPGFLTAIGAAMPEPLAEAADALLVAGSDAQGRVLEASVSADDTSEIAAELGCGAEPLDSLARLYVQAVSAAQARELARVVADRSPAGSGSCPICGGPPIGGVLRDEEGALGRRRLVCSRCDHWWPVPRSLCPHCGETDAERLPIHRDDERPHIRLEACATCESYLKVVDQRVDGAADPLVDDLASIDLDLWAVERGLRRAATNPLIG